LRRRRFCRSLKRVIAREGLAMKLSKPARLAIVTAGALSAGAPLSAEVTRTTDDSFVSRNEVVVEASPKDVWLALISPSTWWQSSHTWSGDAKNLNLVPQAGGCFCETIPEVDEPGRFTLQGSVEHMRVVQAYPEQALRMIGSLGPLQSEPVTGVLTIVISKVPKGTRIVFEYNVGGPMRYEIPVISKAVDGVMAAQVASLAKPLVVVPMPSSRPADESAEDDPGAGSAPDKPAAATGQGGAIKPAATTAPAKAAPPAGPAKPAASNATAAPAPAPAAKTVTAPASAGKAAPVPMATPTAKPSPKPVPKALSVDDAFGDLSDKPKG
jgi:hypothetical protein